MVEREYASGGIVDGPPGRIVGYERMQVMYPDGRLMCQSVPVFDFEVRGSDA